MQPMGHNRKGPATDPRQGEARKPTTSEFFANRLFGQIGLVLAVLAGVAALVFIVGSLGDESAGVLRIIAIGVLIALALTAIVLYVRRRRSRQSLDDALRSRHS